MFAYEETVTDPERTIDPIGSEHGDFAAAVEAVAEAWKNPGPHPRYHEQMQAYLWREWPTLARAVEKLAEYEVAPG